MASQALLAEFLTRAANHPDKAFLHQPIQGQYTVYSWAQVETEARKLAYALQQQGFVAGDRVAILSKNCAHWIICDLAIMMAGLISVPLYHTAGRETLSYVLKHSEAKAIFIGKLDGAQEIEAILKQLPLSIALPYPTIACDKQWQDFIGDTAITDEQMPEVDSDAMYTISYTSGTTGSPKGVELSPNNMIAAATPLVHLLGLGEDDRSLSYLPLAHIAERTLVETGAFLSGQTLYFVESLDTFLENLQTARVTTFFSVPRLWHKFKDTVLEKMPQSKLDTLLSIPIAGRIVSAVIRRKLGLQHAKAFGSGTAPIDKATLRWYKDIGIPISEGWGLTESAAASTCNLPYSAEAMGTIGKALDGSVIKIADNGELMLKGPGVFKQYYKDPIASAEAFTNGWFHTGDLGEFDSRGNIKIIGRIKDQFKTSRGKYVSPVRLESLLAANPAFDLVCVSGSHRSQPVALVVLKEGLSKSSHLEKELSNSLQLCNAKLEIHERIAHLLICPESWSPENGLLTPTLKIRRFQIEQHYQRNLAENFSRPIVWL